MKRSILSALVVAAFLAITGSASAHVVTKADVTCTGVTVSWTSFPGGSFDMNLAFQDQIGSKAVGSPYVVAHLSGASGTQFIPAAAANGVTFRKVTGTWTVDGGGSFTATATVKSCNCKPTTTTTTTTTATTPTQTVTVTTPGVTVTVPGTPVTTPGPTTTVVRTVTTPPPAAVTVMVPGPTTTVAGPTMTVAGPTTTTVIPGKGKTIIRRITRTKTVYRPLPVNVKCPKGFVGSSVFPINKANKLIPGKPVLVVCKRVPHSVQDIGVTG